MRMGVTWYNPGAALKGKPEPSLSRSAYALLGRMINHEQTGTTSTKGRDDPQDMRALCRIAIRPEARRKRSL